MDYKPESHLYMILSERAGSDNMNKPSSKIIRLNKRRDCMSSPFQSVKSVRPLSILFGSLIRNHNSSFSPPSLRLIRGVARPAAEPRNRETVWASTTQSLGGRPMINRTRWRVMAAIHRLGSVLPEAVAASAHSAVSFGPVISLGPGDTGNSFLPLSSFCSGLSHCAPSSSLY